MGGLSISNGLSKGGGLSLGQGLSRGSGLSPELGYDPSASAWFAAMPTQPTEQVKAILNTFIIGLKAANLWNLIDGGNFLCLETLAQGLVDFKNPSRVATTAPGFTSTFTPYRGVTGSGSASGSQNAYIDTGFTPTVDGVAMLQNSAHIGAVLGTNAAESGYAIGANGVVDCFLQTRSPAGNIQGSINNATFTGYGSAGGTSVGHTMLVRTGATESRSVKNGSTVSTNTVASTGRAPVPIRIIQMQANVACTTQVQVVHYGGGLDATQAANLNSIVTAAVTALTVL